MHITYWGLYEDTVPCLDATSHQTVWHASYLHDNLATSN